VGSLWKEGIYWARKTHPVCPLLLCTVPRAQFPRKPALIQTVRILSLRKEGAA
jgi:hypothetical protein